MLLAKDRLCAGPLREEKANRWTIIDHMPIGDDEEMVGVAPAIAEHKAGAHKAFPRHLLCELAFRYQRPYIDVGSEIGGDEKGIVSVDARASYIAPGRPCLQCAGVVTPRRLAFESLSAAERERGRAQGYSDDLVISQPAVMDLNMRATSNGMMVLRHLLQPFLLTPLPVMILENVVTYSQKAIPEARALNPKCPVCQSNRRAGYGDCASSLGLASDAARAIKGHGED